MPASLHATGTATWQGCTNEAHTFSIDLMFNDGTVNNHFVDALDLPFTMTAAEMDAAIRAKMASMIPWADVTYSMDPADIYIPFSAR